MISYRKAGNTSFVLHKTTCFKVRIFPLQAPKQGSFPSLPFSSTRLPPDLGRDVLSTDISISHIPQDRVEVDILLGGCVTQEEVQNTIHVFIHNPHKFLEATEMLEQENCSTGPRTLKRKQCKLP